MTATTASRRKILLQAIYTAITLIGMVILPAFVHVIPYSGVHPLGAYLLPMFVATMIAAFYVPPVGLLLAAICAPLLNHVITGMPQIPTLYFLTGELLIFSALVAWGVRKKTVFPGVSIMAFLAAKIISMAPRILIMNGNLEIQSIGHYWVDQAISIPGVLILLAIEQLIVCKRNAHEES